ncbi:MAG TPA: hypothetical protein PKE69_03345 [Pyrinomonadaceae bacterium]|nr:hypothetical protein [Pyrinomonadaceae bacterium]
MKDEINLPLALQDLMPVTLFAIGLFFVARMISRKHKSAGNLAYFGGVLVTLGGVFKASWKLIQALGGADIPFLNNSLFTLMSAGFICLAWALWKSREDETDAVKLWSVPLILISMVWLIAAYFGFFTESRAWFFILLGATTLANFALLFQLISLTYKNKLWLALVLFLVNLTVIFILARGSDQTVTFQWIKQLINTVSQASFAIASYILLSKSLNRFS